MGDEVKRMADLLKSGATMLSEVCPECGSPLFKIKDQILCPKCNKPVVIVRAMEDETKAIGERVLSMTESTIIRKIHEMNEMIKQESDPEKSIQLSNTLSSWLTALEKIRKLEKAPS